jgi:hypothetical protein
MPGGDEVSAYGPELIRDGQELRDLGNSFSRTVYNGPLFRNSALLTSPAIFGTDGAGKQAADQLLPKIVDLLDAIKGYPGQVRNTGNILIGGGEAVISTENQNEKSAQSLEVGIARGTAVDLGSDARANVPTVSGPGTNSGGGDRPGGDIGTGTGGRR